MTTTIQNTPLVRDESERRKELADFLKTRRARIQPNRLDSFPFLRRRTPGLRREEVAEMARVSSSWYTWLEQGRDIRPSAELLTRIGKVLQLNPLEIKHLFILAGKTPPAALNESLGNVPETLKRFVTKILNVPAFVLGERFEFLLWNQKFKNQIFDLNTIPKERRNWLDLIFEKEKLRTHQGDWSCAARRAVAEFRWAIGKQIGSSWVKELVGRLQKENPEFTRLWKLHDVQNIQSLTIEVDHKKLGKLSFSRSIFIPIEAEHLRLFILTPTGTKND